MTLVAIISDVHADVHALRDALAEIDAIGCERIVCAGDLVDIGLFPEETTKLLRERRIPCVRGNHDRWALGEGSAAFPDAEQEGMGGDATGWALSSSALGFLEALPKQLNLTIDGVRMLICHARPGSDMAGIYADDPSATVLDGWFTDVDIDVLVVGHTHAPLVRRATAGQLLVNPGALMSEASADGATHAVLGTFAVIDTASGEVAIRRVGHPNVIASAALSSVGLPRHGNR